MAFVCLLNVPPASKPELRLDQAGLQGPANLTKISISMIVERRRTLKAAVLLSLRKIRERRALQARPVRFHEAANEEPGFDPRRFTIHLPPLARGAALCGGDRRHHDGLDARRCVHAGLRGAAR